MLCVDSKTAPHRLHSAPVIAPDGVAVDYDAHGTSTECVGKYMEWYVSPIERELANTVECWLCVLSCLYFQPSKDEVHVALASQ